MTKVTMRRRSCLLTPSARNLDRGATRMGEIINLRQARKEMNKRKREREAKENRATHGRAKSERELSEAKSRLERERLDAHRILGEAPDGDDVA